MNDSGSPASDVAQASPASADVFPLEVTPFEGFMLADDRPGYPMNLVIEMHLVGPLDRAAFEEAFRTAVARHPLFTARIERGRKPRWISAANELPKFDWCADGKLAGFTPQSRFDLTREPGLRCWVRAQGDRWRVLWQMSHVASDGLGAMQFIEDFLAAYARSAPGEHPRPEMQPLDPGLFRSRLQYGAEPDPDAKPPSWREQWATLKNTIAFLRRKPVPLAPCQAKSPEPAPAPASDGPAVADDFGQVAVIRFNDAELKSLRVRAMKAETTLNDYLMALLFQTLVEWNRAHGPQSDEDLFRLLMPTNLRRREHAGMPAANMTGFAFLERKAGECRSLDALLATVREDTKNIKRSRAGEDFIRGVAGLLGVRGLLEWVLARKRCLSTALLTNLADPTQLFKTKFPRQSGRLTVGNLQLDALSGYTAIRPLTRASFGMNTYGGQLVACVRCDPQTFSLADAQQMLEAFRTRALS